jgi:hypothetical protein
MIRTVVEGHIEAICDTVHCAGSDVGRGSPEHRLRHECLVKLRPALPSCAFSLPSLELTHELTQEQGQASIGQLAKLRNQRLDLNRGPPRAQNRRRGHIAEQVGGG